MSKRNVIIELKPNSRLSSLATTSSEFTLKMSAIPEIPGVTFDKDFAVTPVPELMSMTSAVAAGAEDVDSGVVDAVVSESYIVRATIDEKDAEKVAAHDNVIGVYADVEIEPQLICPGSAALGSDADVERLLCASRLRAIGADGTGVLVAIVDTGFNLAYLNARGKHPHFDAARSWTPRPGLVPGSLPVDHGSMCAFDVCIAAPNCTLLDIALLKSTAAGPNIMAGLLSDAVRAYSHLCNVMLAPRRPGEARSLVVNNSWGMFHPTWDFPVGHPGNYSDNPNHPFNRIVATLERVGADILFAAGNCGANCPDGRCKGVTANAIYGANGHPSVTTVAGVDTTKTRVGYSSQGPGRLKRAKPDISGYTHFRGSGVYAADGGTSAATPVVAGVFAAIRTKRPYTPGNPSRTPAAIRSFVTSTAEDRGLAGFDYDYGFGVINGCEIARRLRPIIIDICTRWPQICKIRWVPIDICKRYPQLCKGIPRIPEPKIPVPDPGPRLPAASGGGYGMLDLGADPAFLGSLDIDELAELFYYAGLYDSEAIRSTPASVTAAKSGDCSCGG